MGETCEQEEINACQVKSNPKTNDKKNTHEQVAEKKPELFDLFISSSLKHTQIA